MPIVCKGLLSFADTASRHLVRPPRSASTALGALGAWSSRCLHERKKRAADFVVFCGRMIHDSTNQAPMFHRPTWQESRVVEHF